ncbi:MAG: hypothetical protein Tsb0034_07250 [Ekhidna sp.]
MYYTGEFSKEYFRSSGFEIFLLGIVPSLLIHFIGINILSFIVPLEFWIIKIPNVRPDFEIIGTLMLGEGSHKYFKYSFSNVNENINNIAYYNITLVLFGGFLGFAFKLFVRRLRLDRKLKILRFRNEWFYLVSGEFLDFPKIKRLKVYDKKGKKLNGVWVDALVKIEGEEKGSSILYSGILADYQLSKDGGLENLYLIKTYRRYLSDDSKLGGTKKIPREEKIINNPAYYYPMPEHFFVIKYQEVINLNIFYSLVKKDNKKIKKNIEGIIYFIIGLATIISPYFLWKWITGSTLWSIILTIVSLTLLSNLGDTKEKTDS